MGAGALGSMLGLGGAIIVVPVLTLLLGVDIRLAIAAAAVAVVATSCAGAAEHVRRGIANVRLAAYLELGAAAGAVTGAFLSGFVPRRGLYILFGAVLVLAAAGMLRSTVHRSTAREPAEPNLPDGELDGECPDESGVLVAYRVHRPRLGLALISLAGLVGGLLGTGAGILKVPALDFAMRVPWKASTATSTLMIGVTAAASAGVFIARGNLAPIVVAPVALGVALGAVIGSRLLVRLPQSATRLLFLGVVLWLSFQMIRKGVAS
ncbi:MAG: sulfite exporter TauE/SafE family protein [Deltaproteobacteria bacterium]|nr:sulfite exporter TauE/SafE family protein [Deltaproteobacteria bacterium]